MTGQSLDEEASAPLKASDAAEAGEQHKANLLEQFYLTLSVTYLAAPKEVRSVVHERIERLFQDVHSWRNAYEIEQLLCFVLSEQQLETELNRRLAEAHAVKLEHVAVIDKELHSDTSPPADKRIVLHRVLNDLQWLYSKRVQHRAASKRLMVRVSLLFMVALATFSLVLFIQFFAHGPATAPAAPPPPGAAASQGPGSQAGAAEAGQAVAATNQAEPGEANAAPGADSANGDPQDRPTTEGGAR